MNLSDYNKMSNKEKEEYEASIKKLYVILGVGTIFFYIIPYATMFTGALINVIMPMLVYNVNTLYAFMACFLHARKHNFKIWVPSAIALFFVPTIVIYGDRIYGGDYRMIFMAGVYFVLGIFGEFTGYLFIRRKNSKKQPLGLNNLVNGRQNKSYNKKSSNTKSRKK